MTTDQYAQFQKLLSACRNSGQVLDLMQRTNRLPDSPNREAFCEQAAILKSILEAQSNTEKQKD
jgi:hypothetical protein